MLLVVFIEAMDLFAAISGYAFWAVHARTALQPLTQHSWKHGGI
jgi:hypothetical protein